MSARLFYLFTLKVLLIWMSLMTLYSIFRLTAPYIGVNQFFVGQIANYINFTLFSFCSVSVLISMINMKRINNALCVVIFISIYGIAIGLINNNNVSEMWRHFYILGYGVMPFVFGRHLYSYVSDKNFDKLMDFALACNVISCIAFFLIHSIWNIYPGYGTQAIGYVVVYNFVMKKNRLFVISLLALILEGKRGVMISVLFCLYIFYVIYNPKLRRISILALMFLPVVLILILYLLEAMHLSDIPGISRIKYINPFSNEYNLFMGSSGRFDEITSAMNAFGENSFNYIFGAGFGFNFDWLLSYNTAFVENKVSLHMSPLMIFILVGPIVTLFIYTYLIRLSISAIKNSFSAGNSTQSRLLNYFALSGLFFIISGFFALNISSDPIGPMFLGLCSCFVIKLKEVRIDSKSNLHVYNV